MQALGIPMDATIAVKAAGGGDLPLLQHAVLSLGCGWAEERTWPERPHHNSRTVDVCSTPAAAGHLHVIKWARANGAPWDVQTCEAAALQQDHQRHPARWLLMRCGTTMINPQQWSGTEPPSAPPWPVASSLV